MRVLLALLACPLFAQIALSPGGLPANRSGNSLGIANLESGTGVTDTGGGNYQFSSSGAGVQKYTASWTAQTSGTVSYFGSSAAFKLQ